MAQQTAVEWLVNQICTTDMYNIIFKKEIEQAKQMEKEQIVNAWDKRCKQGTFISGWHIETQNGEQYYNETYNK